MKFWLARVLLLLLTCGTTALAGLCFWTQPASFPPDHPSLYSLSLAPMAVAIFGLVATFAPFDNPRGALRWSATLSGLAIGIALAGLVLFTPSFVWLAPPLLIYAFLLRKLARVVADGPPKPSITQAKTEPPGPVGDPGADSKMETDISIGEETQTEVPGADLDAPFTLDTAMVAHNALDDTDKTAPKTRGVNVITVLFVGLGAALCWAWNPGPGHARPLPPNADPPPAIKPPKHKLITKRIQRSADAVELNGNRVRVLVSLQRPRILIKLRQHTIVVEPCLHIEEGTIDGFVAVPPLNGYRLEPTGLAHVELLEGADHKPPPGKWVQGGRGWVRLEYKTGKVHYAEDGVAGVMPALGRRAGAEDITAVVDLELEFATGRVTIDARTHLARDAAVHKATLGWVQLKDTKQGPVTLGLGPDGVNRRLPRREDGRWPSKMVFLSTEGTVARLLKAGRGDQGPYEPLETGPWGGWASLPGKYERLLVVFPDWGQQSSLALSRAAGHGLAENCLLTWWENGGINMVMDVAGTRMGPSHLSTTLPAGVYRNRLVVLPLDREKPSREALRQLERIGAGPPKETK